MPNSIFTEKPYDIEQLKMSKDSFMGKINVITGQDGDYWVSVSPSLNVSGYGKTKMEAQEFYAKKQYSKAFVDENGVLNDLQFAEINSLQTEAA